MEEVGALFGGEAVGELIAIHIDSARLERFEFEVTLGGICSDLRIGFVFVGYG